MKKFLLNILVFSVLILAISYLVDLFLSANVKKSNIHAQKEYPVWNAIMDGEIKSDLLIYGSSRAWININPDRLSDSLHLSAYNIGIDGHNFLLQNLRHKLFLKHNRKPKLIIYSLDIFTLGSAGDLYNPDQFLPYMLWNDEIKKSTMKYKGYSSLDYMLPLVRYCGKLDAIKTAVKMVVVPGDNPPARIKGYQGQDTSWNSDFDAIKLKMGSFSAKINDTTLTQFENFLKECRADTIDLIFVYAPEYIEGQKFVKNRDEILTVYKGLGQKYSIPFYDFSNDSLSFNKKYFYNALHLNKRGAEIFTKELIDTLKKNKPAFLSKI